MNDNRNIKDKEKKEKMARLYLEFKKDLESNQLKRDEVLKAIKDLQEKDNSGNNLKDE